jgi:hypothetical protein
MLTTARPTGDVRATNHELAIARALASVLEDAVSRSDPATAAAVACQLMEQVDRVLRTSGPRMTDGHVHG